VQIEALRGGDVLDWSWSMPYQRWQFDARAITSVVAIQIEGKTLFESMEHNHDLGYQVLKRMTPLVAQRLQAVRGRMYQFCSLAVRVGCGR
jgi:hypothetical protein